MSTAVPALDGLTLTAATPLDVETTNWNAIKIIAVQHGISSHILHQLRDLFAHPANVDSSRDYGQGTPFLITASRLDSGRLVYRFRSRQSTQQSAHVNRDQDDAQHAMPRSSSSGAIYTHPHTRTHTQPDNAAGPSSQSKGRLGASLSRMTANKSLKQSKSIPVLRRKPESNAAPKLPALTTSGITFPATQTASYGLGISRAQRHDNDSSPSPSPVDQAESSSALRNGSKSHKGAAQHVVGYLEEGDVLGAVLGLRHEEVWSNERTCDSQSKKRLQLSPRKPSARSSMDDDAQDCTSPESIRYQLPVFGAQLRFTTRSKRKSSEDVTFPQPSLNTDPSRLLPELDMGATFAKSPRLHQLREAASFESNASDSTARAPEESVERFPPELRPLLLAAQDDQIKLPETIIYDVIQCYDHPEQADTNGIPSSPSHRRLNSATVPSPVPSTTSTEEAQKHQATQAHALPTSAAPGDDPRFSLWAVQNDAQDGPFVISNRKGQTARSAMSLGSPHNLTQAQHGLADDRSSNSGRTRTSSQNTSVSLLAPQSATLLAASAARLVAELTAEIDQPFLVDFFYTYRTFLDPLELLRLLILRFEWAISDASSAEDEARRRIVRVRTYVVLKYWFLHHFDHDFLPRRALRQRLASWLNLMAKDTRVTERAADLNIVNSLRKIVRGLKEKYQQAGVGGLLLNEPGRVTEGSDLHPQRKQDSLSTNGSSSHDSAQLSYISSNTPESESGNDPLACTEDVNLDFSNDRQSQDGQPFTSMNQTSTQMSSRVDAPRAATPRQSPTASTRPARTSPLLSSSTQPGPVSPPASMPHPSSALSRAFVQTVGRLSRFKRVLGNRGLGGEGSSDFDIDMGEFQDLLFVKGGVESLVEYFNLTRSWTEASTKPPVHDFHPPATLKEEDEGDQAEEPPSQVSGDSTGREETPSLVEATSTRSTPASSIDLPTDNGKVDSLRPTQESLQLEAGLLNPIEHGKQPMKARESLQHMASEQTLRSVSPAPINTALEAKSPDSGRRTSLMSIRSGARSFHQAFRGSTSVQDGPNIVQIDDIDLSSDDDDFAVRRALRRLPGARDLRHAKTIRDLNADAAVPRSSMDSQASSMYHGAFGSSAKSTKRSKFGSFGHGRSISADSTTARLALQEPFVVGTVHTEMLDPDEALQGYELVKGFKLDDIESDEEEDSGGVEAALRRLEGIIDEDRQKERAKRVERLWQRSLARNAKTNSPTGAHDEAEQKRASILSRLSKAGRPASSSHTGGSLADNEDGSSASADLAHRMTAASDEPTSFLDLQQDSAHPSEAGEHDQGREAQVGGSATAPLQPAAPISPSGQPSFVSPGAKNMTSPARRRASHTGAALSPSPRVNARPMLPAHRSFVLSFRSETLARQMCLIEAELLRSVTWDELTSTRWKERRYASEVNDWEVFYRDGVRDRQEAQRLGRVYEERAVEAIVSRFNLTSNWVASEVVLTQNIDERAAVLCKLIRVAWKCYLASNFASLTQIIFGLSTPWVERLRKTWSRVGYYEMRIWKDLNSFVGPRNNFRHLRNAMLQLVDASTVSMPGDTRGCIPFFGLYLSDLMVNDSLPTFVDPSMPTHAAAADASSAPFCPRAPEAFASLPPLPAGVRIDPLINLVKLRNTAQLVRQVSAFQQAARQYAHAFEADKGCYVRCLKIRCLSGELLARLSHLIEP